MSVRVAVDTGGTFSDVVVASGGGPIIVEKTLTTPDRPFDGIAEALARVAHGRGQAMRNLLSETELFVYGTTRATNAIMTGTTARIALLTTRGFADTLTLREGGRRRPFDFRQSYGRPYVPRRLTFEVTERVTSEGDILIPLDESEVRALLRELPEYGVEAVAVCLLWSIVNSKHEEAIGELIERELPTMPYTLSHVLNPVIREYRRTSSAAIDASLKPIMSKHLDGLASDLGRAGFGSDLLVITSLGGVLAVDEVAKRPIATVNSGPAMAPVAGRLYAPESPDVIVCDAGGTTFDVSLVRDGSISFTRETWLGDEFTGHLTGASGVDVKSVGAGGGSIAWVDTGGLLRVGPQSAGAIPGPACYGRGGKRPTVSDAWLVLGWLGADAFLGGRMNLDEEAARVAIATAVAGPLGVAVESAAHAIATVGIEAMIPLIRTITIHDGVDARAATMVAGGGAGGVIATAVADALGCSSVVIPRAAGALAATGGLFSDIVCEFAISRFAETERFDYAAVNAALAHTERQIEDFFVRTTGVADAGEKTFAVEARYPSQVWELEIPLRAERFRCRADVVRLEEDFAAMHQRVHGASESGQRVECVTWKGRGTISVEKPLAAAGWAPDHTELCPRTVRDAWFGGEPVPTPRFDADALPVAARIEGPAIVEEATTTIVLPATWWLVTTPRGVYELSSMRGVPDAWQRDR